ncbi:hypothetical protein ABN584_02650 [Gloeocapsa sp. BRSZ]
MVCRFAPKYGNHYHDRLVYSCKPQCYLAGTFIIKARQSRGDTKLCSMLFYSLIYRNQAKRFWAINAIALCRQVGSLTIDTIPDCY